MQRNHVGTKTIPNEKKPACASICGVALAQCQSVNVRILSYTHFIEGVAGNEHGNVVSK